MREREERGKESILASIGDLRCEGWRAILTLDFGLEIGWNGVLDS